MPPRCPTSPSEIAPTRYAARLKISSLQPDRRPEGIPGAFSAIDYCPSARTVRASFEPWRGRVISRTELGWWLRGTNAIFLARNVDQVRLIRRRKSNAANRVGNGYFFKAGDQRFGPGDAVLYGRQC